MQPSKEEDGEGKLVSSSSMFVREGRGTLARFGAMKNGGDFASVRRGVGGIRKDTKGKKISVSRRRDLCRDNLHEGGGAASCYSETGRGKGSSNQ